MAGLLAVHEAAWNDVGSEELVALAELLEDDAVREALSADADALEHAVTPQLVQHQRGVDLARLKNIQQ